MSPRARIALSCAALVGLATLALAFDAPAHAAVRAPEARDPARFGADVTALHEAGFELRELDVTTDPDGLVTISLLLADAGSAERFELQAADWGSRVIAYTRGPAALPEHQRVYVHADDLFYALAEDGPVALSDECGGFYLHIGEQYAALDDTDYYEVSGRWTGAKAQRALTRELGGAMAEGWAVGDLAREPRPGGGGVVLVTLGKDEGRVLRIEHDAHGTITAVERRDYPMAQTDGQLPGGVKLGKKLRGAKAITKVSVDDTNTVRFVPEQGKTVVLAADAIEYPEDEGCGC